MSENIGRKNGLRIPNPITRIENSKEANEEKTETSRGVSIALETEYKKETEIAEDI